MVGTIAVHCHALCGCMMKQAYASSTKVGTVGVVAHCWQLTFAVWRAQPSALFVPCALEEHSHISIVGRLCTLFPFFYCPLFHGSTCALLQSEFKCCTRVFYKSVVQRSRLVTDANLKEMTSRRDDATGGTQLQHVCTRGHVNQ